MPNGDRSAFVILRDRREVLGQVSETSSMEIGCRVTDESPVEVARIGSGAACG
jgi:hypothetical protein